MMALVYATSPSQETVISPFDEGKNEAADTSAVMDQGRIVIIVLEITDESRTEVTDRDREIDAEARGADPGMGTWDEAETLVEMAVMIESEMVGELATVRKIGGIRNAQEAETSIDHGEVVHPSAYIL